MKNLIKQQHPYERLVVSKSDALELFSYNKFKLEIIEKRVDEDTVTLYRCGNLVDLCAGPHLRNTGQIKAVRIFNVSIEIIDIVRIFMKNICFRMHLLIGMPILQLKG